MQDGEQIANLIITGYTSCFRNRANYLKKQGDELKIYDMTILVVEAIIIGIRAGEPTIDSKST